MHPLNSDETAIVIDAIHQNLRPDEYIKHDDSPFVWISTYYSKPADAWYLKIHYNINLTFSKANGKILRRKGIDGYINGEIGLLRYCLNQNPDWRP